jgi:SAM-dependent methyltransferase
MESNFLESYVAAFDRIEGWFSPDAALMFMAYNEVIAAHGIAGNVLEIGVHHGLSAIAIAAIRRDGAQLVAIDLFERLQEQNVSGSGSGSRAQFVRNMTEFFGNIDFVRCIAAPSNTLGPADFGDGFSFCHVDGGHTATETYEDLDLCTRILLPGGLLALDDYFNPAFPGVCEGAIKFWLAHDGALTPIAAGFNKVLFQKAPAPHDLNVAFKRRFPYIPHKTTTLWETPIHSFSLFAAFIDPRASSPRGLLPNESFRMDAVLTLEAGEMTARSGGTIRVPVRVVNRSSIPFVAGAGDAPFGLSYHLLSEDGREMQFNNVRSYFWQPLAPDEERIVHMTVEVPAVQGGYQIEADIVWEGIAWLKNRGLETPRLKLIAI